MSAWPWILGGVAAVYGLAHLFPDFETKMERLRRANPEAFRRQVLDMLDQLPPSIRNADALGGLLNIPTSTAHDWVREARRRR